MEGGVEWVGGEHMEAVRMTNFLESSWHEEEERGCDCRKHRMKEDSFKVEETWACVNISENIEFEDLTREEWDGAINMPERCQRRDAECWNGEWPWQRNDIASYVISGTGTVTKSQYCLLSHQSQLSLCVLGIISADLYSGQSKSHACVRWGRRVFSSPQSLFTCLGLGFVLALLTWCLLGGRQLCTRTPAPLSASLHCYLASWVHTFMDSELTLLPLWTVT